MTIHYICSGDCDIPDLKLTVGQDAPEIHGETPSFFGRCYKLYQMLNGMPLKEMDKITDPVCALCRDHEMAGFIHGVQIGIRLALETKIIS